VADGVMTYLASPTYIAETVTKSVAKGAQSKDRFANEVDITNGIPAFISDDMELAYKAARLNVGMYASFPFYQRMIANIGFPEVVEKIRGGTKPAEALTEEVLDSSCMIGPAERCKDKLEEFRAAGLRLPIIVPGAVGKQPAVEVMQNVVDVFKQ